MITNIVFGLIAGGIYGLLAVGIVLVYRGSRVLNFAQGEIGTFGLYAAWYLSTARGLPWIVGAVGSVGTATLIGLLFERFIVRPMGDETRLAVAVATVGLLLTLLALGFVLFGESPRSVRGPIRGGVEVAGVIVSWTQVLALFVTAAVGVSLAFLLRRTDFGLGVVAAADDPVAVRLVGVRLSHVSMFTWGSGAAISALAVLFIAPTAGQFAPGFASRLFVMALAAALIGGLTSLPGAFAGGVIVGLVEAFVIDATITSSFPGIPTLSIFVLIVAVLLVRPSGLFGTTERRVA